VANWQTGLLEPAVAIKELLDLAKWDFVQFSQAFDQPEVQAEFLVQGLGVISHDIKPTALSWAFRSEGTDDDVTAGL